MNLSLKILAKYGFNQRPLTESDFYQICESENITVLEKDVSTSFYFSYGERRFIVIKKRLTGLRRLFALYHELAHALVSGGTNGATCFFDGMLSNKEEAEADALATIALIPRAQLASDSFLDENPSRYAKKLYRDRQRIEFLYGI